MIDSHCHLFFDSLKNSFSKIIERSINNNITAILSINTEMKNFDKHYKPVFDKQCFFYKLNSFGRFEILPVTMSYDLCGLYSQKPCKLFLKHPGVILHYSP